MLELVGLTCRFGSLVALDDLSFTVPPGKVVGFLGFVLAFLPPTAPFAMTTLVGLGATTWWQFLLSALISTASTVAAARLAATVYRRAILRTGRRVPLREVFGRARPLVR